MNPRVAIRTVLILAAVIARAGSNPGPDISDLVGDWSGTSLCQVRPSACHDETVVYHLSDPHGDKITVQADKIVDGKPITMGTGDWTYQKPSHALTFEIPQGVWKLILTGDDPAGTIFRKVHLSRSK